MICANLIEHRNGRFRATFSWYLTMSNLTTDYNIRQLLVSDLSLCHFSKRMY